MELAYLVFGLALCAIISTGTTLWLMKRRARGLPSPRLEAVWAVTIWGSPILMTGAYWLRVVAGPELPFAALFWSTLVLATILAALRPALAPSPTLRRVLAAMLVLTGIGHVIFAGPLPVRSLLIDAALCLGALALIGPEALHLLRRERAGKAHLAPQS